METVDNRKIKIYALKHPNTLEIRYIGKTNQSLSHKGIKQSEESRRKRSNTIKEWWAKRKSIEDIVKS